MLHKLIIGAVWVVTIYVGAVMVFGAAPENHSTYNVTSTMAVTAQHTATDWIEIDSSIVLETDSCHVHWQATGTVVLVPDQKLYIGFRDGPAGVRTNIKTYQLPHGARGPMTLTWGNYYRDSLRHTDDKTDSIFLDAAVLGTGIGERVTVTNVYYTASVINHDD